MRCEDYPCCGHTNDDPCWPIPSDTHDWYRDPHVSCDHEAGVCDADDNYGEDEFIDPKDCDHGNGSYAHDGSPCWEWNCSHEMTFVCDDCDSTLPARGLGNGDVEILATTTNS